MTLLAVILAAALFLTGVMTGVIGTISVGIHSHQSTRGRSGHLPPHIVAARRILGVGAADRTRRG